MFEQGAGWPVDRDFAFLVSTAGEERSSGAPRSGDLRWDLEFAELTDVGVERAFSIEHTTKVLQSPHDKKREHVIFVNDNSLPRRIPGGCPFPSCDT